MSHTEKPRDPKPSIVETPLQQQYRVRMNVRPIKYACFVREDDTENVARAIRLLCTQWGGMYSLLIPVRSDLTTPDIFRFLLELHEPDRFVEYLTAPKQTSFKEHRQLQQLLTKLWPSRKIGLQMGHLFEERDRTAHALHVVSEVDRREHTLTSYEFLGPETDRLILLALFGETYPGQEAYYEQTLRVNRCRIGIDSQYFWDCQFSNSPFASVVNLTAYGTSPKSVTGGLGESNHFDIVLVRSISSLCLYWNYRATREVVQFRKEMSRRTLLLPYDLLADADALDRMERFLRASLAYPNVSSNLHVRFCVWDEEDLAKLKDALQRLGGLQTFTGDTVSVHSHYGRGDASREDLSAVPITYQYWAPSFPDSYLEGAGYQAGVNAELDYGRNQVFFTPPEGLQKHSGGEVCLDFESAVWQRYPREPSITERITSNSWFSRYGISAITADVERPHYMDFSLPSEWETLGLWFAARQHTIRISRAGVYANALIRLLGGFRVIELLASKPAYLLLDTLALKSTKKLAQRIVQQLGLATNQVIEIQPLLEDMEIVPEMKRIPKTYRHLCDGPLRSHRSELLGLLDQLSNRQVVKRGFHLACANCGTPSWHPLQTVGETVTCLGCSSEFPLPVEYPVGSGSEIQWEYILNTLVNRVMDQDALPAVLAIHHLTKGLAKDEQPCCMVPGLELLQSSNVRAELDFIFVSRQEVFAGECKAGTELEGKDLEIARLAASLGIHHFYFCTIRHFSQTSQESIEALKRELGAEGSPIHVEALNGDELLGEAVE